MNKSAAVIEHLTDLAGERRDDCGVKECVKPGKDHATNDDADNDLYGSVNVALACLSGKSGLGTGCKSIAFLLDVFDDFFMLFVSFQISIYLGVAICVMAPQMRLVS